MGYLLESPLLKPIVISTARIGAISGNRKNPIRDFTKGICSAIPFVKSYCKFNGAKYCATAETVKIYSTI